MVVGYFCKIGLKLLKEREATGPVLPNAASYLSSSAGMQGRKGELCTGDPWVIYI